MSILKGTVHNGQIIVPAPKDWPEGTTVSVQADLLGMEQPAIARQLYDRDKRYGFRRDPRHLRRKLVQLITRGTSARYRSHLPLGTLVPATPADLEKTLKLD